jgi:iron complex outermembrane receptor protein
LRLPLPFVWSLLLCCLLCGAARAEEGENAAHTTPDAATLMSMDMEGLMQVEVVPPAGRKQRLSNVAGSYTVLTEEDIHRSGALNVPEILRTVPGVFVRQVDTDKWSIGVRGFAGTFSSKFLILLDGRPLTSPSMAGVVWSIQLMPVELVKRIEIVRGPWTSLWGSDSFSGVINIISKTSEELQGGQSVTAAGSNGVSQMLRYGLPLEGAECSGAGGNAAGMVASRTAHLSMYAKSGYDPGVNTPIKHDHPSSRDWKYATFGFRSDWQNAFTDQLSIQGSATLSGIDEAVGVPFLGDIGLEKTDNNAYLQFAWDRATGLDAGWQFRGAFTNNRITLSDMELQTMRYEAELLHAAEQMGRHLFTWGVGGVYFTDRIDEGRRVRLSDDSYSRLDINTFVQDRITLLPERLFMTLGMKLDAFGDDYIAPQPTARLLYHGDDSEYWVAVSRAARVPNRLNEEGHFSTKRDGEFYRVVNSGDLDLEELMSYEAGFRHRVSDDIKYDISFYYDVYDSLAALDFDDVNRTATTRSFLRGTTSGADASLDWLVRPELTLRPSLSITLQDFPELSGPGQVGSPPMDGVFINGKLQCLWDIAARWQFDVLGGVLSSESRGHNWSNLGFDMRLQWRPKDNCRVELLSSVEFGSSDDPNYRDPEPTAGLRLTWDF